MIGALRKLGYEPVRQIGSHIRVRTLGDGEHHETMLHHNPLKAGTLAAILRNLAQHHGFTREEVLNLLDL